MRGRHPVIMIHLNQQTRAALQGWLQRQKTPVGRAKRARGVLLLEQGHSYAHTAKWVGLTERNLRQWARRFHEHGVAGLDEKPRLGRTPIFPVEVALYIVKLACERPDNMGRSLSEVGIAQNWLASSKPTASSRRFPLKPLGGSCALISSNRGDTTFGSRPKSPVMTTLPNWSTPWLSSTLVL